jgi:hypothetical protein
MASGIFVNESGRILVSLFFWIGKRVTILLPIFFYHKLAQSLLNMGLGRVVTPPGRRRSLQRFLKLDSLNIESLWFPLVKEILQAKFKKSKPLKLAIDRTLRANAKYIYA